MRLITTILLLTLALPMTAVAYDQECSTADVEWTGESPLLVNVHYATIGVRVDLVADYLWTQYDTTGDASEGGEILSTHVPEDITAIVACPDGLVTLVSVPVSGHEHEKSVVVNVIDYWQGKGFRIY